ncbi:hypothetical protein GQ457_17G006120 [Hibiscus cannabinus]
MASNQSFVGFEEGRSITCPPLFKGDSYFQWCHQMEFFIKALDFDLWEIIEEGFVEGPKKKKNRSSKDMGKAKLNAKAMHTLLCGLNDDVSKNVSSCKSAKEMWEKLEKLYKKEEMKCAKNVTDTSLPQAVDNVSHLNYESSTKNKLFSTKKINVSLDDHNYLLWHQHVYLTIKTHRLLKFIDSSDQKPPKYVTRNGVVCINPEFELFGEQDGALDTCFFLLMQEFLMKIKSLCDNLANSGERISDHEHITAILNGLPPEYDHVITIITASPTSSDLTFVSTILLDTGVRKHNMLINAYAHFTSRLPVQNVVTESSPAVLNSTQDTTFDSAQNQGSVHTSSYSQSGQTGYNNSNRVHAASHVSSNPTIVAGTAMYPPPHDVFSHVQPPVSTPQVHLATSEIMDDNVWFPDSGATHHLTNDYNNIQDGSALPGSGHESGGLYKLDALSNKDKNGFLTQANTVSDGSDKAGVNTQPISSFCKLPVTNNVPLQIWHNRLDLVVADVWGLAHVSSDGFRYYVAFTDAFSGYTWLYFLKFKSQVKDVFVQFHTHAERQFGVKMKMLQTDGGGEFKALDVYLRTQGIVHRLSCPHTSEQNGLVERKHRQVVEVGLTLLAQASMSLKYWKDAFSSAIFLINRIDVGGALS